MYNFFALNKNKCVVLYLKMHFVNIKINVQDALLKHFYFYFTQNIFLFIHCHWFYFILLIKLFDIFILTQRWFWDIFLKLHHKFGIAIHTMML